MNRPSGRAGSTSASLQEAERIIRSRVDCRRVAACQRRGELRCADNAMNTILAVRPLMILVRPCTRAMWVLLACLSAGPAARVGETLQEIARERQIIFLSHREDFLPWGAPVHLRIGEVL